MTTTAINLTEKQAEAITALRTGEGIEAVSKTTLNNLIKKDLVVIEEGDEGAFYKLTEAGEAIEVPEVAPATSQDSESEDTEMSEATNTAENNEAQGELVDPTATVDPEGEGGALVTVSGACLDIYRDAASTFVPMLKEDMTPEERRDAIRNINKAAFQAEDRLNLMAGELLYEVRENDYWKEWTFDAPDGETRAYESFEEYAMEELSLQKRKAQYLTSIYEKLVVELDLPADDLREIEWSKVKEVLGIINSENASELLQMVKEKSLREISDYVKAMRGRSTDTGSVDDKVVKRFVCKPDQAENIEGALALAATMTKSDNDAVNLDAVCTEFTATSVGEGEHGAIGKLDSIIQHLERSFGVTLEIKEMDERYASAAGAEDEAEQDAAEETATADAE